MDTENQTEAPRLDRLDDIERMLADRGHDLGVGGTRVAIGRSGIAFGFRKSSLIHVSWWPLAAVVAFVVALRLRRRAG